MHEARFWERLEDGAVRCGLCRFHCHITEGRRGICGVRENRGGILYTLVYGKVIAEHVDPIEKKPLFHVYPGSSSYSLATVGCNFRCLHCQNFEISQLPHQHRDIPGTSLSPQQAVANALAADCRSIAYTYTEPTIFFEYAYDVAVLARRAGLANVFVSNGYTGPEALEAIAPYLDAANIDLKGFSEGFYREVTGAALQGVLDCLKHYRRLGIWIEVTTLLIPGLNDRDEELEGIAAFIRDELGAEVPWHVTAFYPTFRMLDRPPTPATALHRARRIGLEAGLRHVYVGNLPHTNGENTLCPGCGQVAIERNGYRLGAVNMRNGRCSACGTGLAGVGLP